VKKNFGNPHAGKVCNDQRRNAQTEDELERFDCLPAKLPAFVERPDSEGALLELLADRK